MEILQERGPDITPGSDIRPEILETGEDAPRVRPRGTGRLLSSTRGIGLALLRLEQVEAVEQGKARFTIIAGGGEQKWQVTPYWPDWWPQPPPPEET